MTPQKTTIAVIIGAIVTLTPPVLVYFQGRAELRAKYNHANTEAEAGYKTMVESVQELRATIAAQSDTIARLQGHVEAIERVLPASMRITSGQPLPLPPVTRPKFDELPANLDAAQLKQ